ncbi:ERF family protein [Rhizobium leguminosarum]
MKEIITALNAAYKECGYVQKQKSEGLKYKFAGETAFIEALRPVLIAHGIVVFQSGVEVISTEGYKTNNGNMMNRIIAKFQFTFAHISGESIVVTALGEGADSGDKTAPKCNTGALKYALRQTLLIETGDDPDAVASETQQRAAEPSVDSKREAANAAKADKVIEAAVQHLAPMNAFDMAEWFNHEAKPETVAAMKWVKANYPDKWVEVQGLGFDLEV